VGQSGPPGWGLLRWANHPSSVKSILVKKPPKNKPRIWTDKWIKKWNQETECNWDHGTLNTPGA